MSVRTGDRGEQKLQVLNKARELKEYSLGLVKNDKVFPKSTRWLYASPIAQEIRKAVVAIRHANSINVTMTEEYVERRLCQDRAYAHLEALFDLVDDAYQARYISDDRCEFWAGNIDGVQKLLKAWMRSDRERYRVYVPADPGKPPKTVEL